MRGILARSCLSCIMHFVAADMVLLFVSIPLPLAPYYPHCYRSFMRISLPCLTLILPALFSSPSGFNFATSLLISLPLRKSTATSLDRLRSRCISGQCSRPLLRMIVDSRHSFLLKFYLLNTESRVRALTILIRGLDLRLFLPFAGICNCAALGAIARCCNPNCLYLLQPRRRRPWSALCRAGCRLFLPSELA
jgi:hypothetical protein